MGLSLPTGGGNYLTDRGLHGRDSSLTETERARQYRLVDQMLSMHSLLRDQYARLAFRLNTLQIGISLFLAVLAFVSDRVLITLGLDPGLARLVLGLSAVLILLLAIVEFRADWRGTSARHGDAVRQFASLKAKYRNEVEGDCALLTEDYNRLGESVIPIPESRFVHLKAAHKLKRLLSESISRNPGVPRWILATRLRVRAIRAMFTDGGTPGRGRDGDSDDA